ncbi:MAG: pilus assembly protein [Lysobacteraceae bacterium]
MNATLSPFAGLREKALLLLGVMLLTFMAAPARAAIDLPNVPLQSGAAVPPNIMFIIDDSGSMHWEIMPDENMGGTNYIFPRRVNNIYGAGDYANRVFWFTEAHWLNVSRRSSTGNTTFYNPAVDYLPWVDSQGNVFPQAPPANAPYNPFRPDLARLNLVNQASLRAEWRTGTGAFTDETRTFWPMTFYVHKGGAQNNVANYIRFQNRNGTWYRRDLATTNEASVTSLDWTALGGPVRTPAQEAQNFANWFSYSRSRILSARGGIGRAFSSLPEPTDEAPAPRVGYGSINKANDTVDGVSLPTIIRGVRPFTGTSREEFFQLLYDRSIPNAGTPLRRSIDAAGRYFQRADDRGPWSDTPGEPGGTDLSCRQSFAILMTDGYWNGPTPGGQAGGNTDNTTGQTISGPNNPDFTYIPRAPFADNRSDTLADYAMYYWKTDLRPDLPNRVPTTTSNPAFWQHMVTYGVGLGVTGSVDPQAAFDAIESGATINWGDPATNPGKIDDLLHAAVNSRGGFFSAQNPVEFAEELQGVLTSIIERTSSASNVTTNSTSLDDGSRIYQASYLAGQWSGELAAFPVTASGVSGTSSWRASNIYTPAGWQTRNIFTNVATGTGPGATGRRFQSLDQLNAAQQTALRRGNDAAYGQAVLDYLLGRQNNERQFDGALGFRDRTRVLGDIIHSSPVLIRETSTPNPHATIFVGANDGKLHAFDAVTGAYRFGYVPRHIDWNALATLSDQNYGHRYFVDGDIAISSRAQTGGRNILVGSLGRGGKGLYALDVTNPSGFGVNDVLWEFTDPDLGNVLGKPIIARLSADTNAVIVGNGPNSATNRAFLFIINLENGDLIAKIDTTAGSAADPNGLWTPRGWDLDANGFVDYIYAGDLHGNMWKFDKASNGNWQVAFRQGTNRFPLFTAQGPGGSRQPITSGPSIALDPQTFRRWVFFGTGRYLTLGDPSNDSVQTWYGVIDDDDTRIQGPREPQLLRRSIEIEEVIDGRRLRAFEQGDAAELADKRGWFIDLVPLSGTPEGERIVSDSLIFGRVLLSASIAPTDDPCEVGGSGYINAIDAFTGAALDLPFFDVDGDGEFDEGDFIGQPGTAVGSVDLGVGMPTLPAIIRQILVGGGSSGQTGDININDPTDVGRISWREIVRD